MIQKGCLKNGDWLNHLEGANNRLTLITDTKVDALWGSLITKQLQAAGYDPLPLAIPPGEKNKSREWKERLEEEMMAAGYGRDSLLLAVGGGVVTDLAGFVAATYCRGIPFIAIPTTLLGMVDASIGGKVGINTSYGKNLIGAFHHPSSVLIDPEVLGTLPRNEMQNGVSEMIKYGLIASHFLFEDLHQTNRLEEQIERCCQIKWETVQRDPFERGYRRILNFGHTLGHAIEAASDYEISHGAAVALGMVGEAYISSRLGYLNQKEVEAVIRLLQSYNFPLELPLNLEIEEYLRRDKKAVDSQPRCVILEAIGSVVPFSGEYCTPVSQSLFEEAFHWVGELSACHC